METEAQAVIGKENDTDLVQGCYFARPHLELILSMRSRSAARTTGAPMVVRVTEIE